MTPRIFGLDLLRASAITMVVVAHGIPFVAPHLPSLSLLGHFGEFGVSLFFVLSGFLVGGILWRSGDRIGTADGLLGFLSRRWLRTLPNYYLFLLGNILLWTFINPAAVIMPQAARCALFVQNLAWAPGPFFIESWTLAVEEWFYLLSPLALFLLLRAKARFGTAFLTVAGAMLLVPLASRALAPATVDWANGMRLPVLFRLDAIAFGLIFYRLSVAFPDAWRRLRAAAAVAGGALAFSAYCLVFLLDVDRSWYARTLLFDQIGLGFALLLPWASTLTVTKQSFPVGAVRSLAVWSYSLYLCNWGMHVLFMAALRGRHVESALIGSAAVLAYLIACVATAALVYRYFEKPVLALRDRIRP
jgi:peptidoglycan/LPS O-acetylase OafA/YrhL